MAINNYEGVRERFRTSLSTYMDAVLDQANPSLSHDAIDLEDYILHHRASAGVRPIVHIME